MKKVCTLISLVLLLFVGTAQAQRAWDVSTDNATEILTGDENQYVIQEGINTAGWSASGYLSTNGVVSTVDASCIYTFVQVDEKSGGDLTVPVYVLKNVETGKYLSRDGYVQSQVKAWKFTCAPGKQRQEGEDASLWEVYYNEIDPVKSPEAIESGAWVFCDIEEQIYMCFWGSPAFSGYTDTNNWFIYSATERELTEYEKLTIVFDQYYKNEVNTDNYPVGTAPGCISQEVFNQLLAAYDAANAAIANPDTDPEVCKAAREQTIAAFELYEKSLVPVGPGYYLIVSQRSQDALYDEGGSVKFALKMARPETFDVASAKYIWQVVPSGEKDKYFLKNFGTGLYLSKNPNENSYLTISDTTQKVVFEYNHGVLFNISASGYVHCDPQANVVVWNDKAAGGGQFIFDVVPADTIAKLAPAIEQNQMNVKLSQLVSSVEGQVNGLKLKSGLTEDGNYYASGAGLVSSFEKCNATEPNEGSEAAAFDGNLTSYYHTKWSGGAPTDDWHWVQIDLGKEVNSIYMKFSKRHNNDKGNPSRIALVVPEDGNLEAPLWMDTLYKDTVIYQYATNYPAGLKDSSTYVGKIDFGRPVQHFRMAVTRTKANEIFGYGPCWHVSELRIYDAADCVENPSYLLVDEAIRNAVAEQLAAAKAELEANAATQGTYDALEAAYDAFMEAYPDPTALFAAIEQAKEMHENAVEGEDLAYFQVGSKDVFLQAITAVEDAANAKDALTLSEIEALENQLSEAVKAFNAKLNVPEGGKVYRIVSTAGFDDSGNERVPNDACVASLSADINDDIYWRYKYTEGVEDRFNTLWYVEKTDEGYSFKNLANGLYINNPYYGLTEEEIEEQVTDLHLRYSKEPKYFTLEAYSRPGEFLITAYSGQYMNTDPNGYVVHYGVRNDAHAPFMLYEAEPDYFSTTYAIDAEENAPQIITLPIDVMMVYSNECNNALKVLGKKDNTIQLTSFGDDEVITAGTPFVIYTTEGEDFVLADLMVDSYESALEQTYNYEIVQQNGLVSAPYGFEVDPGYGIIYDGQVVASEGGEWIKAGTGFFNSSLPVTEEEGEYSLVLNGEITGEGLAVDGTELVKNVPMDVYTISGVKVRSNVKAGVATKGLPKGIYIVGGKKVIVK